MFSCIYILDSDISYSMLLSKTFSSHYPRKLLYILVSNLSISSPSTLLIDNPLFSLKIQKQSHKNFTYSPYWIDYVFAPVFTFKALYSATKLKHIFCFLKPISCCALSPNPPTHSRIKGHHTYNYPLTFYWLVPMRNKKSVIFANKKFHLWIYIPFSKH